MRNSACETMAYATTICIDKTGLLTLNTMCVVDTYVGGKKIGPSEYNSLLPSMISLLCEGIGQNTTGHVYSSRVDGAIEFSGSPTEKAILEWGLKIGMDFEAIRAESPIIFTFPFDSQKAREGVAVKVSNTEVRMHWKGGAEIILALCSQYLDSDGNELPLDKDKVEFYTNAIDDMAARRLCCVAIAYRRFELAYIPIKVLQWPLPVNDLVLIAVIGLENDCRPGVENEVQSCLDSGVKVRMVSGDNLQTAKATAIKCKILSEAEAAEPIHIIEGKRFREMSESERVDIADKIMVMGRSSPRDKLLLVQALQKRGDVVCVTGNGVDDVPALVEADIGLAMGIQGTEVAKEKADIIILDDDLATVVKVVRWGRSVYVNIQKFIQFNLAAFLSAMIINYMITIARGDDVIDVVKLLLVNLMIDFIGAFVLVTETPTDQLMQRPPIDLRAPIITRILLRNSLLQGLYQAIAIIVINYFGMKILLLDTTMNRATGDLMELRDIFIFNAFFYCQVFNMFNARRPNQFNIFQGIITNRCFMASVIFVVVVQAGLVMYFCSTMKVFLGWKLWLLSIGIGLPSCLVGMIGKFIPV